MMKATPSSQKEKRKYPRVKTENLLSFICFDENNLESDQGVGKAIGVSQGGLLLESHSPIETDRIILTTIIAENEFMEIKARVAYRRKAGPGIFHTGVQFLENIDKIRQTIVGMIKLYNQAKTTPS